MVELVFNPDGTVFIPRGNKEDDEILRKILSDLIDAKVLESFYSISEKSEVLFGDQTMCG